MTTPETILLFSTDQELNQSIAEKINDISYSRLTIIQIISQEDWENLYLRDAYPMILLVNLSDVTQPQCQSIITSSSMPVIILTDNQQQGQNALQWGAVDYLEKSQLTPFILEKSFRLTLNQHQAYQENQQKIQFYQHLINGLPQSIYTKDRQGKLIFANQALLNSLGMTLEEAKGKTVYDFYPLELAQKYDQDDQIVLKKRANIDLIENHQNPITEEIKKVQVVKSPLYNKQGEIIGTQGIFWDVSDRYQTEQVLQQSEAQFRGFFEQAAVGMAIASIGGNIIKVNRKICELSDYSEAELLQKTFLELSHPDDVNLTLKYLKKMIKGEINSYSLEKRYLHHDGKAIWTQVTTTLVRNNDNEPAYLIVILEDIQERKIAEEQIRYRLRLETAIAEASQALINHQLGNIKQVLQQIGRATNASRAYLVQFSQQGKIACMTHEWCAEGIKPDQKRFQNVDLSTFIWWRENLNHYQNIIISELDNLPKNAQAEKQYLQSIGVNSILAIPIFDHQGNLWGQLGLDTSNNHFKQWSNEDVHLLRVVGDMLYRHHEQIKGVKQQFQTYRRLKLLSSLTLKIRQSLEIDQILQTAVQEIRKTFKADRTIFYRFNADGSGKVVNESLISGMPSLLNLPIADQCAWEICREHYQEGYVHLCKNVPQESYAECYANLLKKHQIIAQIVVPILTMDKDKLFKVWGLLCVQMCCQPRQWTAEEVELLRQLSDQLGIALFQAQLREQEIAQKKELARSNAELEQFAYIASHDLRQPLQIVADFAKLLQRRYGNQLDEKANQYINHIILGSKRMEQQIADLLQYSRVGRKEKIFELIPIQETIEQAIANLQKEIEQSKAKIQVIGEIPRIQVDKIQIVQLFQNLIDNAIKYRQEIPPLIQIKAELKDHYGLFSITDNGIGIEPIYFQRIFQIFQRLHTQDEYPGTGIGLAICQRIVKRHGGEIWLQSRLGEGTIFYFTLPLRQSPNILN